MESCNRTSWNHAILSWAMLPGDGDGDVVLGDKVIGIKSRNKKKERKMDTDIKKVLSHSYSFLSTIDGNNICTETHHVLGDAPNNANPDSPIIKINQPWKKEDVVSKTTLV